MDLKEELQRVRKLYPDMLWCINHQNICAKGAIQQNNKRVTKLFSVKEYGIEKAYESAKEWKDTCLEKISNGEIIINKSRIIFKGEDDFIIPETEGICLYTKDGNEYLLVYCEINKRKFRKNVSIREYGKKAAYEKALELRKEFIEKYKDEIEISKENRRKNLSKPRINYIKPDTKNFSSDGIKFNENIDIISLLYYDENSASGLRWKTNIYYGNSIKYEKDSEAGKLDTGYYSICLCKIKVKNHRIIYEMFNGEIPDGMVVDHINRNSVDNKIENLRIVMPAENSRNAKLSKANTSGVTGVRWYKDKNGHTYAVAYWRDLNGKSKTKQFSLKHMSKEDAFCAAVEYRKRMIDELNSQGAGYTPQHGKEKGTI